MYQYVFNNELIGYDYKSVDKNSVCIEDIIDFFKNNINNPSLTFRSEIFEVPLKECTLIPKQKIIYKSDNKRLINIDELDSHMKIELDKTVQYMKSLEVSRNVFEKMKRTNNYKNIINNLNKKYGEC